MANDRGGAGKRASGGAEQAPPRLGPVVVLLGSIAGAIAIAAALRVDPDRGERWAFDRGGRAESAAAPAVETAPPGLPAVETGVVPEPAPLDPVAARVERDVERIAAAGGHWTAQLALLCDPERIRELIERFGGRSDFYVLPADHDGRACVVLCWGLYADPAPARAASDLPPDLRAIQAQPFAKRVAEILEAVR